MATPTSSHTNQPNKFCFPSRTFGSRREKRKFKHTRFEDWPWLDYEEDNDLWCALTVLKQTKQIVS